MSKPPKVTTRRADPLQDFYIDRDGNEYSVARLIDDARDLPVFDVPVAAIDLSSEIWAGSNMLELSFHIKKVMDADLSHPILLDWNGAVADGRHRILKAIVTGQRTIKARRIHWKVTPCRKADDRA